MSSCRLRRHCYTYTRFLKINKRRGTAGVVHKQHAFQPEDTYKHLAGAARVRALVGTGNLVGGKLEFLPPKKALLATRSKLKMRERLGDVEQDGTRPRNVPSNAVKVRANSSISAMRPPWYSLLEEIVILEVTYEILVWRVCNPAGPRGIPGLSPERVHARGLGWQGYRHWLHSLS